MEPGRRGRASMSCVPVRPSSARPLRDRGTVTRFWTASLLLAVLFVPLVPSSPAAASAPGETGKYYIVGPPVNGQREYLYSIALNTLGNGNRFREIVELNRGRKQPDGAVFTDGLELAPGWILVLPRDAKGPGVRTGPLPTFGPQTPSAEPSAVAPAVATRQPSTTPPTPSATTQRPSPSAVASRPAGDPVGTVAANAPPNPGPSGSSQFDPLLVRIGAGVLAVAFAVVALLVLRGRVYSTRSVTLDDGPWPPERHHTPTPAELDALAAEAVATAQPARKPKSSRLAPAPSEPPAASSSSAPDQAQRRDQAARTRPPLPADGDVPYVQANVLTDVGPILVRLVGVTTGPTTPAYAWLADDEPAPSAAVPLVLGYDGPWQLHIDLGRTPDVFTLVGAMEDCRRLAAAYARQLHARGITVAVAGNALGVETFDGCRSLSELSESGDEPRDPFVVIVAPSEDAGSNVRGLIDATGGRGVPMVIGPVPASRWSAQLEVRV